jgi:hypothetical protein
MIAILALLILALGLVAVIVGFIQFTGMLGGRAAPDQTAVQAGESAARVVTTTEQTQKTRPE